MVRVRHILDPDLKAKVLEVLSDWRGLAPSAIPEWFELDDHDFSDILAEIKARESGQHPDLEPPHDPRA
jgi:hypothetical protein